MSASASKKKRKELEEQGLSAKDLTEKKAHEQKTKILRNVLITALVVIVCAAAVFGVIKLVNRPSYDTKAALATVGEEKITVPMFDYFYNLNASNSYNYIQKGTPLSQQSSLFSDGTMEDYLIQATTEGTAYNSMLGLVSLKEIMNVVSKAHENNFELSKETKDSISDAIKNIETTASAYGFPNVNKFLRAQYGEGMDSSVYKKCLEIMMTYSGYGTQLSEEFQPTAEELQAAYDKDPDTYDLVSFTYAVSNAESSTVETETDSDADADAETETAKPTTYTDEAKAAAKAQAEAYAEELPEDASTVSYNKPNTSSYFTEDMANWLFDEARQEGDVKVFAKDDKEISFYTVRYNSRDTNDYCRVNANVLSVAKDKEGAEIKEGQQTAVEKRDALIAAIQDGMSDEDFSAAVSALGYTVSNTLVTNSYSLEEVREWLFDSSRKAGDLLTSFENDNYYYVVRYVSTEEDTYRNIQVKNTLWNEYYGEIINANELVLDENLLQYANTDLTLNDTSSES